MNKQQLKEYLNELEKRYRNEFTGEHLSPCECHDPDIKSDEIRLIKKIKRHFKL